MSRLLPIMLLLGVLLGASPLSAQCPEEARELRIEGITRITHLSTTGANLYVEVVNATRRRLVVKSCEVEIAVSGGRKVTLSLRDRVVVPKGHSAELLLPLRFRSAGTLSTAAILRRIAAGDYADITVTYRLRGGTWLLRRTFSGEDIAISEIFDNFALSKRLITEAAALVE